MADVWSQALEIVKYGAGYFAASLVKEYYERKKKERDLKRKAFKHNNMDETFARRKKVYPILNTILSRTEAERVMEYSFSNGETTFTGYHLKKLSITCEAHLEGTDDISGDFQLIPAMKFKRNMDALHEANDDFIITDEGSTMDDLGYLNRAYGLNFMMMVKVRDEVGRWVGILVVSYPSASAIGDEDIPYVKLQAARIGAIK